MLQTLPIITGCASMEGKARDFKLFQGRSAETSGGLLCAVEEKDVDAILKLSGGYVVGRVEKSDKK